MKLRDISTPYHLLVLAGSTAMLLAISLCNWYQSRFFLVL